MRKLISPSLISLSFIFVSAVLLSSQVGTASPMDDPKCAGLTGAALGLCAAATAVGCDGSDTQAAGCTNIAEQFTQITGETPPWALPECPCGSTDYMISYLAARVDSKSSCDDDGKIVAINTSSSIRDVWSNYGPRICDKIQCQAFYCGFVNTTSSLVDDDQAKSCALNIKNAASHYNLSCLSPTR